MAADFNPSIQFLHTTEIFQHIYNSSIERIRVDSNASVSISGVVQVQISAAAGDNIALANQDGSLFVGVTTVSGQNGLNVNVLNSTPISGTISVVQSTTPWVTQDLSTGSVNVIAPNYVTVIGAINASNNTVA